MSHCMRMVGLVIALSTVLIAIAVHNTAAFPLEDVVHRAQFRQLHSANKRAIPTVPCPNHPLPIPQPFISEQYMPDGLREAMKRIDASIREELKANFIPAASVGIVYDQELVWAQGYGLIDPSNPKTQVNADTVFRVGSITKLITTIMLFQLRDQGKLSLDDPISKYVPALSWPSPFVNNPGITWRTLAGQVSGLTGVTPCNFFTIWEPIMGDACDITNDEAWRRVTAEPPSVPMWEFPHYADSPYAIIGRALESVVGMSWEDYIVQHIFKPLGMDSTFIAYDQWSEMAKRIPPAMYGNASSPSFMAHIDLQWARPTGNVYSTVKDMAKLASVFMVGQDERKNALGLYSSTLREMMTAAFVNDDQSSGYAYPFEIHHSSFLGSDVPPYWVRFKGGATPGYFATIALIPEIKTAMVVQSTNYPLSMEPLALLLPAMEQTLWELQPLPNNPGNLTAYAGTYIASLMAGFVVGNVTVRADAANNALNVSFAIGGMGNTNFGSSKVVWEYGNTFRVLGALSGGCLDIESGRTNALLHFKTGNPSWFGGPTRVVSVEVPADPFYGWVFVKQ